MADFDIEGLMKMSGTADVAAAQNQLQEMGVSAKELGIALVAVGGGFGVVAAAALVTAGALSELAGEILHVSEESVKMAAEYETSLNKLYNLTSAQPDMVDKWRDSLIGLSAEVGKGPKELSDTMFFIASHGYVGAQALDAVKLAAEGSAIGMGDADSIAKALVGTLNAYSSTGLTAAEAMDILTVTVREGGTQADALAGALGRVSGVAAAFGVSFQEVGAYVATFTRTIPSAQEAVTSLRQLIINLEAPSHKTKEALKEMGLSVDDVVKSIQGAGLMATLQDLIQRTHGNAEALHDLIPNVRALAGALNTAGAQGGAYAAILDKTSHAAGTLQSAFERTKQTLNFQWSQVTAQFDAMYVSIGMALLPAVEELSRSILPAAAAAMKAVGEAVAAHKDDFTGLATAVKDVALGIGQLASKMWELAGTFSPIVQLVGAIKDLVAQTGGISNLASALGTMAVAFDPTGISQGISALRDMGAESRAAGDEAAAGAKAAGMAFKEQGDLAAESAEITQAGIAATILQLQADKQAHHENIEVDKQHAEALKSLKEQFEGVGEKAKLFNEAMADPKVQASLATNAEAYEHASEMAYKLFQQGAQLGPQATQLALHYQELAEKEEAAARVAEHFAETKRIMELVGPSVVTLRDNFNDLQKSMEMHDNVFTDEQLKHLVDQLRAMALAADAAGVEIPGLKEKLVELFQELDSRNDKSMQFFEKAPGLFEQLGRSLSHMVDGYRGSLSEAFDQANKDLEGLNQALGLLGVSADNSWRTMLTGVAATNVNLKKLAEEGIGAVLAGLAQMAHGFAQAIDSGNRAARAIGGMMAGANIGKQIGMLAGPMGAAWGAVIGGLIGLTVGLFHKPAWQKVGEEAGKILGGEVSKALAKEIEKTMKDLHLDVSHAALLFISKFADETGKSMASMTDQVLKLMAAIADGSVPAKQGIEELTKDLDAMVQEAIDGSAEAAKGLTQMTAQLFAMVKNGTIPAGQGIDMLTDAFNKLKSAADEGNKAASDAMFAMVMQARAAGVEIAAISQYVKSELDKTREALLHMPPIVTEADAISQASIFSAAFWGAVQEEGLVAAATAFLPAWEAIKKSLQDAGIDRSVVESIFGSISPVMRLVSDSVTGPIVQGIDALNQALTGLSNSGYMTQQAFEGFEQQAQALYDRLIAAGVSPEIALQAIAPLLQNITDAAARFGFQIDANTASLIGQATASGIAFSTDPQMQMVDLLQQIVVLLGGTLPAASTAGTNTIVANQQTQQAAYRATGDVAADANYRFADSADEAAARADAAYGAALGSIQQASDATRVVVANNFSDLADRAGESGDYVGVVWAQNIDEISLHAERQVDPITAAFQALADGAIGPANEVATAVGGIVDALHDIPPGVNNANNAMGNLHGPGDGGGPPGGGPHGGGGGEGHAAFGAVVPPRPGGSYFNVAEAGQTEVIAPVRSFMVDLRNELTKAVVEAMGSGGNNGAVTVVVQLGERTIDHFVQERINNGYVVVRDSSIMPTG